MEKIIKQKAIYTPVTVCSHWERKAIQGFTLIELMIVVVIIAILAAIAFPSYQAYVRRSDASLAQQEMQKIAEQLERHKAKNFSYREFDPNYIYGETTAMNSVTLPRGATGTAIKYTITIRDAEVTTKLLTEAASVIRARGWAMKATTSDTRNYSLLMTSEGLRCKNKSANLVTYTDCGTSATGSEGW